MLLLFCKLQPSSFTINGLEASPSPQFLSLLVEAIRLVLDFRKRNHANVARARRHLPGGGVANALCGE
jgi:hypothetical protein